MTQSEAFFHAMAPVLTANILTVALIYCLAKAVQKEIRGEGGRAMYLWVAAMVLLFMLYGFYVWDVGPNLTGGR